MNNQNNTELFGIMSGVHAVVQVNPQINSKCFFSISFAGELEPPKFFYYPNQVLHTRFFYLIYYSDNLIGFKNIMFHIKHLNRFKIKFSKYLWNAYENINFISSSHCTVLLNEMTPI